MLKRRYQLLLIAALVVAAYYPILFAGYSSIDDREMIDSYAHVKEWSLWNYFIPSGGLYYRPLISISYLFDKLLTGPSPAWMHLENVLLHLVNAVLVYFIAQQVLPLKDRDSSRLPLAAALLFGLHPIATESVNWISGRTDVLAESFLLLSVFLLIKFKELRQKRLLAMSLIALLSAPFAKETALALLPGFILIAAVKQPHDAQNEVREGRNRESLNGAMALVVAGIVVVSVTVMLRSDAFISHQSRMAMTIRFIFSDWMHTMLNVLRTFGFYMKKLIFPLPLNFSIMEVDPLYEIVAVPFVALCIFIASRRTILSAVFLSGVLLIVPAFVLAFGQIAWTPYAERYVYMASAFFVVAAVGYANNIPDTRLAGIVQIATLALILAFFASTLARTVVWKDDFLLSRDTVEKSPLSRDMRMLYGHLLAERGDFPEALRQLEQGKKIPCLGYDDRFDLNIGGIYEKLGDKTRARDVYETAFKNSHGKSTNILIRLIELLEEEKNDARGESKKQALNNQIFSSTLTLYKLNHDPHLLYKLGLISIELYYDQKALKYFQQAYNNMTDEDEYKKLAKNKIEDLSRNK